MTNQARQCQFSASTETSRIIKSLSARVMMKKYFCHFSKELFDCYGSLKEVSPSRPVERGRGEKILKFEFFFRRNACLSNLGEEAPIYDGVVIVT